MDALEVYYKNSLLNNLCEEYRNKWRAAKGDKTSLLKLSLCQQSIPHVAYFAHKGEGLTKEFLKGFVGEYINGYTLHDADDVEGYTYGLFVDYPSYQDLIADKSVCSLMWCKETSVVIPKTKATTLYISNNSDVTISCEGFNFVRVYIFDESRVTLEDLDEDSFALVYRYSKDADVLLGKYALGKCKMFDKELKI